MIKDEKYIFFCDQDDVWIDEKISIFVEKLNSDKQISLVHSDAVIIDSQDQVLNRSFHRYENTELEHISPSGLILKNSITGCTMAVTQQVLKYALPFPRVGGIQHDLWLALVASRLGKVQYLSTPLVKYRQHNANTIGASVPSFFKNYLHPRNAITAFLIKSQLRQAYLNLFSIDDRFSLNYLIFSKQFSLRQKLYAINYYFGMLLVIIHDLPTNLRILMVRNFAFFRQKITELIDATGEKRTFLRKASRIMRFAIRLMTSKKLLRRMFSEISKLEKQDYYSPLNSTRNFTFSLPQTQVLPHNEVYRETFSVILMVPTLHIHKIFGGVASALKTLTYLSKTQNVRICVTDEPFFEMDDDYFEELSKLVQINTSDIKQLLKYVEFQQVTVSSRDVFLCTAWWTMAKAKKIATLASSLEIQTLYLVQDFEPLFYSSSDLYVSALQTYHDADILLVNSVPLANYIADTLSIELNRKLVFAPQFISSDLPVRLTDIEKVGPIKIIIYGRPSTERNLFLTLIESLQMALGMMPYLACEIISLGELHDDIALRSGHVVRSAGKLSVNEYVELISASDIGISLMMSPHPSYPPLEMASAGMQVITNDFFGYKKDLAKVFSNLHLVEPFIGSIAQKIFDVVHGKISESNPSNSNQEMFDKHLGNPLELVIGEVSKLIRTGYVS